jgi:hypothetical protein
VGWERAPGRRYWRVEVGPGSHTAWYSQAQIVAWLDGANSMGAGSL